MSRFTLEFCDPDEEREIRASQFEQSYETYQLCLGAATVLHAVIPWISPNTLPISGIYFPISVLCCVVRAFLKGLNDQLRAHTLCQRLWVAVLIVGPGLQFLTIQLNVHPLLGVGEAMLYMFAYAMVVMTMHIQHFSFLSRSICISSMFLSLSTSGWGGWSGQRGWTTLGQPHDTVVILCGLGVGSLFGHTIERMMRGAYVLRHRMLIEREDEYRDLQRRQRSHDPAATTQADIAPFAFETLGLLGRGGSGDVFLVRKQRSQPAGAGVAGRGAAGRGAAGGGAASGEGHAEGAVFALKRVSKVGLSASRAARLREECRILQSLSSPFLVRLEEAFQTDSCVYLAMTYAGGGDLTLWIERMTARSARLVTAEVLLGLRYLHSNAIIYRDLKLENTLVGLNGHVLLSDFGVSKRLRVTMLGEQESEYGGVEVPRGEERRRQRLEAQTLLGTPSYMAPEQFSGREYSYYVDYWAAAVMLHELLTGRTTGAYDAPEVLNTGLMDAPAADMLTRMLLRDRGQRLGCGENGLGEIMGHSYFGEVTCAAPHPAEGRAARGPCTAHTHTHTHTHARTREGAHAAMGVQHAHVPTPTLHTIHVPRRAARQPLSLLGGRTFDHIGKVLAGAPIHEIDGHGGHLRRHAVVIDGNRLQIDAAAQQALVVAAVGARRRLRVHVQVLQCHPHRVAAHRGKRESTRRRRRRRERGQGRLRERRRRPGARRRWR